MADQVSEPVKKCAALLKNASSDSEKFAGLFLVTKLVKAKDCKAASKKALFEAIGFKFLKRLLLTTDVPVDCPPAIYKSVALSVLTCFCNERELATHKEMLENIPVFLDIVQQADNTDYDDNLIIVGEAYGCLKSIASYPPGQQALLEVGAIAKMSEIYAQQSFQTDEALNILVTLVTRFGAFAWPNDPKSFHTLVNKIALDFETDHTERKFELCTVLHGILFNSRPEFAASSTEETWPQSIYKGLTDILTSKIGKQQRNPALKLAATALQILGAEWTLSEDEEKPRQFFLLLIQLGAIEVRMQLDGKSLQQAFAQAELITSCFIILEVSIGYIAMDQLDLEQKEKQTLYTGLKGAFTAVISLLGKIQKDKNQDKLPIEEKTFVCACVRVLVAWLAQETSAMRKQVYELLPYLLKLANETFYASKARKLAERAGTDIATIEIDPLGSVDILRIMLPALCHLAVEDEARRIILSNKEEDVLFDSLNFHWSIVHYKKPPVPKSERLKQKKPEAELSQYVQDIVKDSRTAMISLCNVLMNLTVLEAKLVEDSATFNNLLKFIFNELPELKSLPENIVLHGNMAILGLLLLKQQSKHVKKNDFSICRYIQATIRFLWDAYVLDESNDPTNLVISMTYKEYWTELMELWFLGMQTMSAVLTLVPWISEFAIESGWAEGIVQMLKNVKIGTLPPNVKSAYEDFLCHIVDANESVVPVLKKADALRMCRNHRFMELGKKLFGD